MNTDLVVTTEHSRYEFDTKAKLFTRQPVHQWATDFGTEFVEHQYDEVLLPGVGKSMTVYHSGPTRYIRSTGVVSIDDLLEKEKHADV